MYQTLHSTCNGEAMDAGYQTMHGDGSVEKSNTRLENYKKWHRMVLITQDG
jgi:hypothetical protein